MEDCIFCKIVKGDIPSKKAYEDDKVVAFYDIAPMAPVHILVIPKKHIDSVMAISDEDDALIAHIFKVIRIIAEKEGLDNGFRLVSNIGEDGGQTVKHLHFHILGKKKFADNFG